MIQVVDYIVESDYRVVRFAVECQTLEPFSDQTVRCLLQLLLKEKMIHTFILELFSYQHQVFAE